LGQKYIKTQIYWLGFQILLQNRFDNLANSVKDKLISKTENKILKLPIFVAGVANVIQFTNLSEKITKNKYDIKMLNNTQVKIQPKISIKYTTKVKIL